MSHLPIVLIDCAEGLLAYQGTTDTKVCSCSINFNNFQHPFLSHEVNRVIDQSWQWKSFAYQFYKSLDGIPKAKVNLTKSFFIKRILSMLGELFLEYVSVASLHLGRLLCFVF